MEILLGLFAITIPIFYVWGAFRFLKRVFGNETKPQPQPQPERQQQMAILVKLLRTENENPDMTLGDFMAEVRAERVAGRDETVTDADTSDKIFDDGDFDTIDERDAEQPARLGDLVSTPRQPAPPPKPAFSFSEWYQEHTVDFILYLGAFLIVAAVSLFVSFQWESFGGITRFSIVLGFTVAWFVAGGTVRRAFKLENVGLIFVTIGAVLVPFCGIAWQQFVVGSGAGLGITWLLTAIAATVVYMVLSLIYRRRYFTYFGNLSILAMILSLVQINDAPQEYFILAGCFTSLLMLFGRLGMRAVPDVDDYFGTDFERSSLGIIGVSVLGGFALLGTTDVPFFSIQVLAVLVTALVYTWVYNTLHFNALTIGISQVITVSTVGHALITFNLDPNIVVIGITIANIALQFALNYWLKAEHPTLYRLTNAIAFGMSIVFYLVAVSVAPDGLLPVLASTVLMLHAMYAAYELAVPVLWYVAAILQYLALGHLLVYFGTGANIADGLFIMLLLGVAQTLLIFVPLPMVIKRAFVSVGLAGATLFNALLLLDLRVLDPTFELTTVLNTLQVLVAPGLYALVMVYQRVAEADFAEDDARLLDDIAYYLIMGGMLVLYAISVVLYLNTFSLLVGIFALLVAGNGWLAYRVTSAENFTYLAFGFSYLALYHLLYIVEPPIEVYPLAATALSYGLFFSPLPQDAPRPRRRTTIVMLGIVAVAHFFIAAESEALTEHIAVLIASYGVVGLMWTAYALERAAEIDLEDDAPLLPSAMLFLFSFVTVLFYGISASIFAFSTPLIPVLYAVLVTGTTWVTHLLTGQKLVTYATFISLYMISYHLLYWIDVPPEVYPIVATLLSYALFFAPIPTSAQSERRYTATAMLAFVAALIFMEAIFDPSMTVHFAGWVAGYGTLGLLLAGKQRSENNKGYYDGLLLFAGLLQYYWHIIFCAEFVNQAVFDDVQWYSAPIGVLLLAAAIRINLAPPSDDADAPDHRADNTLLFHILGVGFLMLPTLSQILSDGLLVYFVLGLVYALGIAAIGITFDTRRLRTWGAIALVLTVLAQTGEFIIALPRWLLVGGVGFGLLGAGLFLALRNRNTPSDPQEASTAITDDGEVLDFDS